jgi:hypothetical protein
VRRRVARVLDLVIAAVAVGLIVWRFVAIDQVSHSVSDTLRPWLVEAVAIVVAAALGISLVERVSRDRHGN